MLRLATNMIISASSPCTFFHTNSLRQSSKRYMICVTIIFLLQQKKLFSRFVFTCDWPCDIVLYFITGHHASNTVKLRLNSPALSPTKSPFFRTVRSFRSVNRNFGSVRALILQYQRLVRCELSEHRQSVCEPFPALGRALSKRVKIFFLTYSITSREIFITNRRVSGFVSQPAEVEDISRYRVTLEEKERKWFQ